MAGVPPPPRQLEVRRFAAARAGELRSLYAAVSSRLDDAGGPQQPRSARRRTTGHLPNTRRRRGAGEVGPGDDGGLPARKQSRAVRRRRELAGNPAEGFSVAGDGARRLRTHLWYAKRFFMERRWGFILPDGAQGRARGSRCVLKRLKNGTTIHDAGYFIPIELDGPEDALLSILRMVLRPSPVENTPDLKHLQDQVMRGVCYENAMLWDVRSLHSQIVGPVTYMWRPFSRADDKSEIEGDPCTSHSIHNESGNSSRRQLWIWIHPAALDEGISVIRFACERQIQDSAGVVKCCSLEGKIARLEVNGCKAMQSLKKILHPTNSSNINMVSDTSDISASTDTPLDSLTVPHLSKASVIDNADILQPGAILSMVVHDPREVSVKGTDSSKLASLDKQSKVLEEDVAPNANEASSEVANILPLMWMHPGKHDIFLSDCRELWDSRQSINPPVSDEVLCKEKHCERMKFFCLDSGNDKGRTTQEKDNFIRSCPVILLKHAGEGMPALGWSIILPLSWVKPFWLFLVSHGAHAIGLRERRWIAAKFRMPCFPYDYPDSKAYASYASKEAAGFDKVAERCPVAKRPPSVPVPPLWHCIMTCFHKDDGILGVLEVDDLVRANMASPKNSSVHSKSGDAEASQANVASLQLHVPRTTQMLRQYVEDFDLKYLSSSSDMKVDSDQPNLAYNDTVKMARFSSELCLTRVLIRAFKVGSFEEGAVVCAPFPSDLSAWKIRSKEEEEECVEKWELQLPQSHVSSYFSWFDDPSTSSLQLPTDAAAREAFRWPIGFVTSGFIHGSNGQDAVAVAFCEAKLLAVSRRQQWAHENLQSREICVLVRNARSAAYRRALATIVLEHQESDLEFL
ncbi:ribonucleases P/MRP protein subunit POP1-like [Miscanthus floridulus]|uniref:ribonucleases P/MRP protein subunit POP1-like n=1 Tax=Miscanthus floridulus TaxID=154761 RepID=UPI00345746B5